MSLFLPNIPQPNDALDFSQSQLLSNNQGLDTVFGVDHYKFSDATANKGFHNQVTTPEFTLAPPTPSPVPPITGASPIFYALKPTTPIGVLQYSRGPTNAIPTPVTDLQSPATPITLAPNTTTNVVDFTGISTVALATLYISVVVNSAQFIEIIDLTWTPAKVFSFSPTNSGSLVTASGSGNILQIKNFSGVLTASNLFWTLDFHRIQ